MYSGMQGSIKKCFLCLDDSYSVATSASRLNTNALASTWYSG